MSYAQVRPHRRKMALALAVALCGCASSQGSSKSPDEGSSEVGGDGHTQVTAEESSIAFVGSLLPLWAMGVPSDTKDVEVKAWFAHEGSGTCVPTELGEFSLSNQTNYGPGDSSVTIEFPKAGTWITMYTYPVRSEPGPEFDQVAIAMRNTCEGGGIAMTNLADSRFPGARIAACGHVKNNVEFVEEAVLYRDGDWYHKARATFPKELAMQMHMEFVQALAVAFNACGPSKLMTASL